MSTKLKDGSSNRLLFPLGQFFSSSSEKNEKLQLKQLFSFLPMTIGKSRSEFYFSSFRSKIKTDERRQRKDLKETKNTGT